MKAVSQGAALAVAALAEQAPSATARAAAGAAKPTARLIGVVTPPRDPRAWVPPCRHASGQWVRVRVDPWSKGESRALRAAWESAHCEVRRALAATRSSTL